MTHTSRGTPTAVVPSELLADPGRLAEVAAAGQLDHGAEEAFDRITRIAQRTLAVPAAMVTFLDAESQHFKSEVGLTGPWAQQGFAPAAHSYCQYAVATGERLVIADARTTPLVRDSPALVGQNAVAYAGEPLETGRGNVLGTLCVIDHDARDWSADELDLLHDLAALAITEIEARLRGRAMSRAFRLMRRLGESTEGLGDALRSLSAVADGPEGQPRAGRLAALARTRFASVESIVGELRALPDPRARRHAEPGAVDVAERLERAVRFATVGARASDVRLDIRAPVVLEHADGYAVERALTHLVVTALIHAVEDEPVAIMLDDAGAPVIDLEVPRGTMPASELAGIVARLDQALTGRGEDAGDEPPVPASVSMTGRTRIAQAGGVRAVAGPDGTRVTVQFA